MLKTKFPASGNMSIDIEAPELYIKLEKIDVDHPEAIKKSPEKNQINNCENGDKEDSVDDVRHSDLTEIKQEVVDLDENHSENHIQRSDSIPNNVPPIRIKELAEIIDIDTSSDSVSTIESVSSLNNVCQDSSNNLNPSTRTVTKQYGRACKVKIGAILNTSTGNLLIPTQVPRFELVKGPNGKPTLKQLTNTIKSCDILNIPSNSQKGNTNVAKTSISNGKKIQLNGKTQNVTSRSDTNSRKTIKIKAKKVSPKIPTCSREKPSNFAPSNGAAFLHSQVRTNPALQSILEDIFTLNQQYYKIDDKSIAAELDKLRTKNQLPLITFKVKQYLLTYSHYIK